MKFTISNKNNYKIPAGTKKNFKNICHEIKEILKIDKKYFFEVIFVSKYKIKKLNSRYRQKNKVTDVITFSFYNLEGASNLLGEIYICYDQCLKQSKLYQKTLKREISFMFLHGMLHLFNFDHQNKKEEEIMFKLQDKILEKLKI